MISIATLLAMNAKEDCDLKVILRLAKDCVYGILGILSGFRPQEQHVDNLYLM